MYATSPVIVLTDLWTSKKIMLNTENIESMDEQYLASQKVTYTKIIGASGTVYLVKERAVDIAQNMLYSTI